jgi:hypothetical protein
MATQQAHTSNTEAEILARLVRPEEDDLTPEAARALLRLQFDEWDLARLHELVTRNQDGILTAGEQTELDSYLRVSALLDLVQAKARRTLKKHA